MQGVDALEHTKGKRLAALGGGGVHLLHARVGYVECVSVGASVSMSKHDIWVKLRGTPKGFTGLHPCVQTFGVPVPRCTWGLSGRKGRFKGQSEKEHAVSCCSKCYYPFF